MIGSGVMKYKVVVKFFCFVSPAWLALLLVNIFFSNEGKIVITQTISSNKFLHNKYKISLPLDLNQS